MTPHPDWIVPDWPAPHWVRAVCTTRAGGVSAPPYDSLNLGDHVHDEPAAVRANRRTLQAAIAAQPVFLRQVHGVAVLSLDGLVHDGLEADACMATRPGIACTVMVADCLPVLLTDTRGRAVAAAHAGWRGLAGKGGQGVLEVVVQALMQAGTGPGKPEDFLVWLGPCIGPTAFEVGKPVHDAFCGHDSLAGRSFQPRPSGKYLADLQALARHRLEALGITRIYGNDGTPAWCTVGNPSLFFSHRRDSVALGGSGRMACGVWLEAGHNPDTGGGTAGY